MYCTLTNPLWLCLTPCLLVQWTYRSTGSWNFFPPHKEHTISIGKGELSVHFIGKNATASTRAIAALKMCLEETHNLKWRLSVISHINWAYSPWRVQGARPNHWSPRGKLSGAKAWLRSKVEKGGATIRLQRPERWLDSFAQSWWLPAATRSTRAKVSVDRAPQSKGRQVRMFGTWSRQLPKHAWAETWWMWELSHVEVAQGLYMF